MAKTVDLIAGSAFKLANGIMIGNNERFTVTPAEADELKALRLARDPKPGDPPAGTYNRRDMRAKP